MANEDALHRCVTEFMLDTCRYTKTHYAFGAYVRGFITATTDGNYEALSSGSSAEFYIKPMLPCVGDIDTMIRYNSRLAIPAGQTPPTELPPHFKRSVTVYEIIDSRQPGYVYLQLSCTLAKDDNGHQVVEIGVRNDVQTEFLPNPENQPDGSTIQSIIQRFLDRFLRGIRKSHQALSLLLSSIEAQEHGPAMRRVINYESVQDEEKIQLIASLMTNKAFSNLDLVPCMQSLRWPPQAAEWPTRSRIYGVPDTATITTVVNNGCDVVGAVHPSCRQDEWMNTHQWRLSFSRAEVTLLNNWTPVQQITYHMLRVIKREVLSKTNDNDPDLPTLSNYHIKTLMLWECEQKPPSWWSAESSLIKLCSSLLHKLSDWVAKTDCEHYFISNCNLIEDRFADNFSVVVSTHDSLQQSANESFLLLWFVENYIRKCTKSCPADVSALFGVGHIQPSDELAIAVRAVTHWKLSIREHELYEEYFRHELNTLFAIQISHVDSAWIRAFRKEQQTFSLRLRDYYTAVASLHVAYTISIHSLTEELLETLWMFSAAVAGTDTDRLESAELLSISKAVHVARLSSVGNRHLEMLHNEIAKVYLHQSLQCGQECTYCVVHTLLAALYYKSGHYQSAIDHCKQALNQCDSEPCNTRCIAAEYLPQIDESVDAVFGLVILYQHVQREAFNSNAKFQPTTPCPRAFTTKLLANYLCSNCSAVVATERNAMRMYRQHLLQTKSALLSDTLLFRFAEVQLYECKLTAVPVEQARTDDGGDNASSSMDTSQLVRSLERVALEKLISARQVIVRELHSEQFPVVNEFEALRAYKCGLFEECLQMCSKYIDTLRRAGAFTSRFQAVAFPEMLLLLDSELVSLFGVIRLFFPRLFLEYPGYLVIYMPTFLVFLIVRCQQNDCNIVSPEVILNLIRYVYNEVLRAKDDRFVDRLILKLIYRKLYTETFSDIRSR